METIVFGNQVFDLSHFRESDLTGETKSSNRSRGRGVGRFPSRRGRGGESKRLNQSGSWNVEPVTKTDIKAKDEIENFGKRAADYFDNDSSGLNKRTRF